MNPEAIKQRNLVKEARSAHAQGKITQAELYRVVDNYRAWMIARVGKKKAARFSRAYILRAL